MNRYFLIFGLVLLLVGVLLWNWFRPTEGVETMSPGDATVAWIGLVSAVIGLISAIVGLVTTFKK